MLEYSIHSQRMQKSFLYKDFILAIKQTVVFFIILVVYIIGTALLYLLIDVFGIVKEIKDPTNFLPVVLYLLYFGSFCTIIVSSNMNIFKLQDGIIRQKEYTFNTLLLINILFFIIITFLSDLFISYGLILFSVFTLANIIYIIRLFKEYFYYRTDHLRLCLIANEKFHERRNLLLKRVIKSPSDEDFKIIKSAIEQELNKSQTSLPAPEYGITGMMLYIVAGSILKIKNEDMIVGNCTPIHEVKEIKLLNKQQIRDKILKKAFDMKKITYTSLNELRDPAEKAIKTILESKSKMIFERIPDYYRGLQRFIGLYPVLDDEKLIGTLVVFKDTSEYLFPEEEKVITGLIDNIRIIMSIMEGKIIQHEKNRLQGEINIARKIQLSILPQEITIQGYDCACFMETATEAGGDAYDFINTKHGNYFGIGDVSGHGLPAGIMALMQMSAFESCVYTADIFDKEIKPDEIYSAVNKVLYNINKKRMGSDKYMTQNYMIENEGTIVHAGAHEIALRYVEKEERIYELKDFAKKTAFLGISPSIDATESFGSFTLMSGDVLLLYSDGIIEAKNHYLKQFGIQKLKEAFQDAVRLSAKEIIETIMKALYEFAKDGDLKRHNGAYADDVTLLVLKKL
ncbi:MAG: serine/threonine-protein phosphatase [Spirochaetales bacterium]|nr:serine/threonine-protein phosphatase [Spirochaetales bacterium]